MTLLVDSWIDALCSSGIFFSLLFGWALAALLALLAAQLYTDFSSRRLRIATEYLTICAIVFGAAMIIFGGVGWLIDAAGALAKGAPQ